MKNIDDKIEYKTYSCSEKSKTIKTTTTKDNISLLIDNIVVIVLYLLI